MVGTNLYTYDKLRSGKHKCFFVLFRTSLSSCMELSTILVNTTASLLVVVFGAWLAVTFYLHRLHKKYAHIPSPKMPRWAQVFLCCTLPLHRSVILAKRWGFGPFKTMRSRRRSEQNPQSLELLECVQSTHNFYHIARVSNRSRTASKNWGTPLRECRLRECNCDCTWLWALKEWICFGCLCMHLLSWHTGTQFAITVVRVKVQRSADQNSRTKA